MSHKDRGMSICPGTVLSVLSLILYCAGFIRIDVNLNGYGDRLVTVEKAVAELKQSHQDRLMSNEDLGPVLLKKLKKLKRMQRSPLNSGSTLNGTAYLKEIVEDIFSTSMKICQQQGSNKFCLRGRPGPPGRTGSKGDKGDQGKKGRRGSRGMMGEPGRSGKQGIMGPPGVRGEKGVKGNIGSQGTAGIKGEPGESISPPKVTIPSPVLIVNESKTASLLCSVSGNPSAQLLWSKLNGSLPSSRMKVTPNGLMQIVNVQLEDAGKYKCLAQNILGKSEKVAELVVQALPRISLSLGPTYVQIGHNVTLPECVAIGFPTPRISWSKAKIDLRQERRHTSNNQLSILNAESSDSGLYRCKASNKLGTDTASTHLVVVEKPKFIVRPPSHLETRIFQNITVACQATGNPLPRIYWTKENGNLPSGRSNSGVDGKLKIWGVQPEDSGNYKCVASSVDVIRSFQTMHLSVEGLKSPIKSHGGFCLQPESASCSPADNTRLIYHRSARCSEEYMLFSYKDQILTHACSGKNICPQGGTADQDSPLVISSTCQSEESKFVRTSHKTLRHKASGFCVHPHHGQPKEGIHAVMWNDDCREKRLKLELYKFRAACKPVGVADRNKIPDDRMTASNIYSGNYQAYFGRLHEARGKAWCPKAKEDRTDFLQIDMGKLYSICAVATQGCRVDSTEFVKSYKLHLSADGATWKPYKEQNVEKV